MGSTGSIGTQALEIVGAHPERFEVVVLTANENGRELARQANRYRPGYLLLAGENGRKEFEALLEYRPERIFYGASELGVLAELEEVDLVLNSLVGFAGFEPTCRALAAGKRVALANKESLVVGGEVIRKWTAGDPDRLLPVDSEHSAMLQCLTGEELRSVEKVIITASGGPFRDWSRERMKQIRVEDALDHPNWSMGAKVTVDSSTMMNKGLEVIEAHWLFDLPIDRIEPVVHPQSVIHSIVQFVDGSSKAQLSLPDMKIPISYALGYPERLAVDTPRVDWSRSHSFTFEPVDYGRFPCLELALEAGRLGGHAPAVMNAANEVAVERFLKREIGYIDIAKIVERSLETVSDGQRPTQETLTEADRETRERARAI